MTRDGTTQEAICALGPVEEATQALVAVPAPVLPAPVRDSRRSIHMAVDATSLTQDGQLAVTGWALSPVGIARVEVRLDGLLVGEAELALPRQDVAEVHAGIPMARYAGFHFAATSAEPVSGLHEVTATAVNGLDDEHSEVAPVEVTCVPQASAPHAPANAANGGFRLEVDTPTVVDGTVTRVIFGMLTIEGWALAPSEIVEIAVSVDSVPKGKAHHGFPRSDVAAAFPEREDALRSGFKFRCPLRGLESGLHTFQLTARAADGEMAVQEFRATVQEDVIVPAYAQIRRRLPPVHAALYTRLLEESTQRPQFAILLRLTSDTTGAELETTLQSLVKQICRDWRLCILADDSVAADLLRGRLAGRFSAIADRVEFVDSTARQIVPPEDRLFLSCLSPGDELGCDALAEVALFAVRHPGADVIYADEFTDQPGYHCAGGVLQARLVARPAAIHELFRPALVRGSKATGGQQGYRRPTRG